MKKQEKKKYDTYLEKQKQEMENMSEIRMCKRK